MPRLLPLLLLPGCPYLWGPPEFSDGRDFADADADSDADSDTDADTDTFVGVDPQVTLLSASLRYEQVVIRFTLSDPQGDLTGGALSLTAGADATPTDFLIPDDLDTFDGVSGSIVVTEAPACEGFTKTYTLRATDVAGNSGQPLSTSLTLTPSVNPVPEGGEPRDLGVLTLPAVLCGLHHSEDDIDNWQFELGVSGARAVWISHTGGVDSYLSLVDDTSTELASSDDSTVPDSLTWAFAAGTVYGFRVSQSEGPGQSFTIVISP